MKYLLIISGTIGIILLIAIGVALFVGVPSNQQDVVKIIDVKKH